MLRKSGRVFLKATDEHGFSRMIEISQILPARDIFFINKRDKPSLAYAVQNPICENPCSSVANTVWFRLRRVRVGTIKLCDRALPCSGSFPHCCVLKCLSGFHSNLFSTSFVLSLHNFFQWRKIALFPTSQLAFVTTYHFLFKFYIV